MRPSVPVGLVLAIPAAVLLVFLSLPILALLGRAILGGLLADTGDDLSHCHRVGDRHHRHAGALYACMGDNFTAGGVA